jgi:hypothetical protein
MKNENYTKSYDAWKKRLESKNVSFENAIKRLKYVEEQLSNPFNEDEHLSVEGRNEILTGRKNAIIDYIEKVKLS